MYRVAGDMAPCMSMATCEAIERQLRERQTAVNIENSDRETTDPHADPPFLVDPTRLYSPDGHTVDGKWLMTVAKMNDVKGRHLDPASVHAAFGDQFMRTLVNDENFDEQDAIEELQEALRQEWGETEEGELGWREEHRVDVFRNAVRAGRGDASADEFLRSFCHAVDQLVTMAD